ncbi:MAG: phage tail tape measure protein [Phocaeicola sp.]
MGIVNKDNALYWATGIDNSGLYKGREEAMGILKGLASQVTSFDIFGGIGVSAAMAFAKAAKGSYDFQKEFNRNMMEVATISKEVSNNISGYSNQILDLTRNIPVQATDAAKALYQIISAGHDGADGMKVLEVSAKAAVGGVTDTATAADAITTVLNSYKKTAEEAGDVSDMLFTTVRLGKTTFGELGQTISQVSPIAASFGIEIEEVLAAVASLTKQGVPTSQAMTQIRAAITGAAGELGDAAFEGRSLQDAMQMIYDKAGGSATVMKEMLGTQEAVSAVLAMTGSNALSAASDLDQLRQSVGAAKDAFALMASEASNQMTLLGNNVQAALAPMGEAILKQVSDLAKGFNEAFASGDLEASLKTLTELILAVSSAIVVYKGSLAAAAVIKQINVAILRQAIIEKTLEKAAMAGGVQGHTALTAAQLKEIATKKLLIAHIRTQTAALKANAAAMITNPYIATAVAVAGVGYAIYKMATYQTDAEKGQKRLNDAFKEVEKSSIGETRELARLKGELDAAKEGTDEYKRIKDEIVSKYGKYHDGLDKEIDKVGLLDSTYKKLTDSIQSSFAARQYESFKESESSKLDETMSKNLGKIQDRLIDKLGDEAGAKYYAKIRDAIFSGGVSVDTGFNVEGLDSETKGVLDKISGKSGKNVFQNRAIEGYIRQITTAQELTDELDKKARAKFGIDENKPSGGTTEGGIDRNATNVSSTYKADLDKAKQEWQEAKKTLSEIEKDKANFTSKQYQDAKKAAEDAEKNYKNLGGNASVKVSDVEKKKQEEEKINNELLMLQKQSQQAEIDLMTEGSAKKMAQIELNYKNEIERLQKLEKEWMAAQGGKLTSDQAVSLSVSYSSAENARDNGLNDVEKADNESLKELLNQYQDYAAKRLSIKEQYTKDIQKLEKQRTDANASEIDRAVAVANESMKNALQSLDMEELQKEIDWSLVFGNLSRVPTEGLSDLKKKLQDFIATNNELSPENLQAVVEAIDKITTEQTERDPFSSLAASFQTMKDANVLLKESQEAYTKALESGTAEELKNAKAKLENAKAGKQKAQSDATESLKASVDRMGEFKDVADGVLGVLQSFGMEVPDWLGGAMGGIDDIISGLGEIDLTKPMSVITGGLKALSGAVNTIASLGGIIPGMGESDKSLTKDIERLSQSNNDLKKAIDNLSEKMEKSSVAEATGTYNEQKNLLEQSIANTKEMMQREGAAYKGGIGGSHSSNYQIDKNMGASDWARISSIVGKSVNSAGDFWNLTSEEMAKVSTEATDLYSKIKDYADDGYKNAGQYMDAYIEYYKELEELENQWREKLTSSSFDTIRSDFKSALMDMEADAETFAENFESLMKNAMLESMMSETYNKRLQEWYENFSKSMEDGALSSSEQSDLKTEWDKIVQNALDERNAMFDAMGWDSSSTSSQDQGSSRGFNAMSQETGDELSGRFTALQIATEEIRNEVVAQTGMAADNLRILQEIYSMCYVSMSEHNSMVLEIIDLLSGIKKDTSNLSFMRASLERIEENTKNL